MLVITVELLLGTYRADPSGLAHTGRATEGEWPPAPLRLLAALVAADGTRERCRHTTGEELAFLEVAPPPRIYASALDEVHHQVLSGRYVVQQAASAAKGAHQEYHGRQGSLVRPGVRVSPRRSHVAYEWDVDPSPEVLAGLRTRAARVGYLGTADSPVAVRVESAPASNDQGLAYEPDERGSLVIGVPRPGVIRAMDLHYDRWLAEGPSVHRSQSPGLRRLERYRAPGLSTEDAAPQPTLIALRLAAPVSGRRVSAVTAAFKAALLDLYQRRSGDPPAVLHGHVDDPGSPHTLAYYLALPDAGHRHARGLIRGLALVLPVETSSEVVEGCRRALQGLSQLHGAGFTSGAALWSGEKRPLAVDPERWTLPSRRFATVFPALHERRGVALTLSEVARWCDHAGLPKPIAARSGRGPFIQGGADLRPPEVNRPGRPPRPYSHLELEFAALVSGPVVIGAGRQRGLGLCLPMDGGGAG